MTESKICTCPSGDGSLRWPCPKHPAVEQAGGDERAACNLWIAEQQLCQGSDISLFKLERNGALVSLRDLLRDAYQAGQARAALAQPSPVRSSLLINGYQLRAALDFIAPDGTAEQLESETCIEWRQQDADFLEAGLYAFCAEYPEEGGVLLDEEPTTAQPSPLQSEQAEAERPEVVAWQYRVTAGSQTGWSLWHHGKGEEFERSYTVERRPLMTVAQHERIVGALRYKAEMYDEVWALVTGKGYMNVTTAISVLESERAAALARVAEMERQEPVAWMHDQPNRVDVIHRDVKDLLQRVPGSSRGIHRPLDVSEHYTIPLYAAPVAQAQHSVPEEFSFEYRHPNGESHTVTVSRDQVINEMPDFLFEALCSKFCNCEPAGETNVVECCCDEYAEEFKLLAAAPGNSVPQAWLDVQAERRRQVTAEGWTPEHDDAHSHGQMARAAACYALAGSSAPNDGTAALLVSLAWPWDEQWWKPSTARRDLVKACALALAEIERLDRAGISQSPQPGATTASS
ncbi:TPA: hypothetical protein ACSQZ0_001750 [Pseudomonas aeruginosa]